MTPSDECTPVLDIRLRFSILQSDVAAVRTIVRSTGLFTQDEERMAGSLVRERLTMGPECDYNFLFAESGREVLGYACFGPIDCTDNRYDLFWIAVRKDRQHLGLGAAILASAEEKVRSMGGVRLYAETSSQETYAPTRRFYEKSGFRNEARLADFYRDGDDKVFYVKNLSA